MSFIPAVSSKLIKKTKNANYVTVGVPNPVAGSDWGRVVIRTTQATDVIKKDGSVVNGVKNIVLGKDDKERTVSIATDKGYKKIKLTNREIAELWKANRAAYKQRVS